MTNSMKTTLALNRRAVTAGLIAPVLAGSAGRALAKTQAKVSAARNGNRLTLSNGLVRRVLELPSEASPRLATIDYRPVAERSRFFSGAEQEKHWAAGEFGFRLNGVEYGPQTDWSLASIDDAGDENLGSGVELKLISFDRSVEVFVRYLFYPGSPVVRKRLSVRNISEAPIRLENVNVEDFTLEKYHPTTYGWIYSDYGRRKSLAPFLGGRQDSLVALHNPDWGEGLVIGNEAPGVMKYTGVCDGGPTFRAGLARSDSDFPFRRWLAAGQLYVAPQVFSCVYTSTPDFDTILNTTIPDFIRKHLGAKMFQYRDKPRFVYNTWEPFQQNISSELVKQLATSAAAAGARTFVIDDGWQDIYGDWNVDADKFPGGLRPVMNHIKALGMRPGIWVSIGSADKRSRVFNEHPEWFVRDEHGRPYSVHGDGEDDARATACMSTGWRTYITQVLAKLIEDNGLEYLKLDFAVVTSPYQFNPRKSGCYAKDHDGHKDWHESLSVNYEFLWEVFDELKARYPAMFIDCTFETMGGLQLVDYAMLQHAEGNWLSNFNQPNQANDLRIRNMAWWRSPAIPATSLVIGNARFEDHGLELHLQSLSGSLPIVLGDPRAMSNAAIKLSRRYADFMSSLQARHDIFSYRQDLRGFGEPAEGRWDGFQRINTETRSGGLIGIFRQNGAEPKRRVTIAYLDASRIYEVRDMDRRDLIRSDGASLLEHGLEVELPTPYAGKLLEVVAV